MHRFEQVFEWAPQAMLIVSREGRIVRVNAQLLSWFGYTRAEIEGQPVEALIPERFRSHHTALRDGYMAAPSMRPMGTGLELFARRKDGTEFPVDISLSTLETEDGLQAVAAIADMTERKRTERALHATNQALARVNGELEDYRTRLEAEIHERRQTEQRVQQVFELAPHAMVIVTRDGKILHVNTRLLAWFGYSREELIGQPVEWLVPERFRGAHPRLRDSYMASPSVRPMGTGRELFGRRKDGSEFPVDISLSPVDVSGELQVIAGIADITERKRDEVELRQTNAALELVNKELETFAYSASHDLRQPVRAMSFFAQVLMEDYAPALDGTAQDYLIRIQRAGMRMGELIDALLDLSRISRAELQRQPVDLSTMAREIVADLALGQPHRHVAFTAQPGLSANADPQLVRVLMTNLLGNAWKFTGRSTAARIEFASDTDRGERVYHVSDNGAGFDMTFADKLFGAFQRLHGPDEFPGTGIGLATSQRVVRRHGGRIWAKGAEGAGATFYFTL